MLEAGLTLNKSDIAFRIKQTLTRALLIALTWIGFVAGAAATTSAASITIGAPAPSAGNAVAIPVTINNVDTGNVSAFASVPADTGTLAVATSTGVTPVFGYDATTFQRSGGRELGFTGTIAQVKAALGTLTFTPETGSFDVDLAVSISEAPSGTSASSIYYFPDNGHYYEYVAQTGAISWTAARDAAAGRTLFGLSGYLVTITSTAEQDFVASQINAPNIWIGASDEFSVINAALGLTRYENQAASEGQWYWVTGPEAGTQFWKPAADGQQRRQANGGSPVGGEFSAWCSGEPNNSGSSEHYGAANFACGSATPTDDLGLPYNWNDFPINNSNVKSYLVEYGGLPNQTSTAISADATACLEVSGSDVSGCNTITIVGTGGSALGAGWGFQSGVITATQDIDINASEVVGYLTSGDLTIDAGTVVVATNVTSTSANDLTLRARNDVQVGGVITTAAGSVVLWANSAGADTGGGIFFELDAGVTTAGGHIWMGGSATLDGSTTWNGLTVGDGYAVSGKTVPTPVAGTGSWLAAVSFKRNSIESGGGDIRVYGRSNENNGIGVSTHRQVTFDAGNGQILIEGINEQPDSRNGFLWGMHSSNIDSQSSAVNISSSYSGNGYAVTLTARHGNPSRPVAGLSEVRLNATGEAGVYIQSVHAAGGTGLELGVAEILAAGGDIVIETAASTLDAGTATLGFKSGSAITTSSSDITIIANTLTNLSGLNNNTTGALTIRPVAGDSFSSALNTDSINYSAGISGLTLGGVGNTSLVSINSDLNIAGDISVYAGQIVVNGDLTASTGSITLDADTGSQLSVSGSGVVVNSNKELTANNGTIFLKGRGGDSGSTIGVVISAGAKLNTTSGAITITGVGGNGSGDGNHGVQLGGSAPSAQIKTTGGDIVITGAGGGTGASKNNDGISALLADISSGAGAIILNGGAAHTDSSDQRTTSSESIAFDGVVTLGHSTEQSGNITIIGDVFWFPSSSDARQIRTSGSVVFESPGAAFASPITFRSIELNGNTAALRIGKDTNTVDLTIASELSVAGNISIYGGNIDLASQITTTNTSTGDIVLRGGALTGSGNIAIANGRTATVDVSLDGTYSGLISGANVSFVKEGAAKLTLSGANTFTGMTLINEGTLSISSDSNLGAAPATLIENIRISDAVLEVTASTTLHSNRALRVENNATIAITAGSTSTYLGQIFHSGRLIKEGDGALVLGRDNNHTGGTRIAAGTVSVANLSGTIFGRSPFGHLPSSLQADFVEIDNGVLEYTASNSQNLGSTRGFRIVNEGTIRVATPSGAFTVNGPISGPGNLIKDGGGNLLLAHSSNSYGETIISDGTLQVGNNGSSGSLGAGAVVNNASLVLDRTDNYLVSNAISGTGSLTKQRNGAATLTANNTYSGPTSITGTLILQNNAPTSSNTTYQGSGQLRIESLGDHFAADFLTDSWAFANTLTGLVIGKSGNTANITLGATVSIAGPITVHGGNIAINAATTTASNINLHASGAVTQSVAITAQGLSLSGSGSFALQNAGNTVGVMAGGTSAARLGSLSYFNHGDLTIGAVNPTGIYASGDVLIETAVGNINLTEPINTTSTTNTTTGYGGAIVLNAGKSAAIGSLTGGDILVSEDGAVLSSGINKLYSGSDVSSTGLTALAGGSVNTRRNVDETTVTFDPVLTGNTTYALYRGIAGEGDLTIVSSGGAAENVGWVYNAGVLSTIQTTVSINASDAEAKLALGPLTIQANNISLASTVTSNTDHDLVLKAKNSITLEPGHAINTAGGDVIFWADSDADGVGGIRVGSDADSNALSTSISTDGGHIILSGGASLLTGAAGFDVSLGAAKSEYFFSVGVFRATLDARSSGQSGGAIIIRGNSGDSFNGLVWTTQLGGQYGANTNLVTKGAGAITVFGDGSQTPANATAINSRNSWAVASSANLETEFGDITLVGRANVARTNARGFSLSGRAQSVSGTITVDDQTPDTSASNYSGPFINAVSLGLGTLSVSNSDIVLIADKFFFNDNPSLNTDGSVTMVPKGGSFQSTASPNFVLGSSVSGLTMGKPGNTAAITFDRAHTIDGPITVYGGNIAINAATTTASNINLDASGAVTQSAAITAQGLVLTGGGSFTLQNASNTVGVIAGGTSAARLGSLSYLNNGDLTIGAINPAGIYASGAVLIETETGDIAVTQSINSTLSSGTAIELNTGKSKEVGDGTGGDILVSGDGAISIQSGAVAILFSGSPDNSTGLSAQTDEVLVFYDETNAPPSSAFSAGNVYAIYRTTTPTQLTIATQPSATAASGVALATQPTVSITDAFGNVIRTDNTRTIQVEIFSGDNGTLLGTQQATVVNGVAEFADLALIGPVGTSYRLRFSSLGLVSASSTEVALTAPGPVDLVVSSISADPVGNLMADGTEASAVVVTMADTYGNPIAGETVVLALSEDDGRTLEASTGSTNAVGQFATTLASTMAGSTVVSAFRASSVSANLIGTASVGFLAGAPTQLEVVSGNTQAGEVAQALATPLIVRVRDAQGNVVAGASVVFAGDGTTTPTSGVAVSNAEGIAQITWAPGEAAGTQAMIATLAGSEPKVTVSFSATAEPGPPAKFAVLPASSRQLRTIPFALEVVLQDAYGNRTVADSDLTVALSSSNLSAAASLDGAVAGVLALEASPTVAISDQTLRAGADTITLSAVVYSGLSALDVETPDIELIATASFGGETLTGKGMINARNIYFLITATPEVITANGVETSLLTTQLKDLDDEIVPSQLVWFANTRGLLLDATTLEPLSDPVMIQADANGQAQVRLRAGTVAQTASVTAVSRGADPVSAEIEFEAGPPAKVIFSKVDNSIQLGPQLSSLPFAVKVALLDAFDNPTTYTGAAAELVLTARTKNTGQGGAEAGELRWANQTPTAPVSMSVPSGTSSLIFSDVLYTGLSGVLVGQDVVLTATGVGGLSGLSMDSQGFSVRDIKMTIMASTDSLVADGASQTEITVTLTDAEDVAQPGQNITAETSLGTLLVDGTALSNPLISDANGQVRFVLRTGMVAGTATVTAHCLGACPVSTVVVFVGNVAGLVDELSDPTTQPTPELYEDAGITGVDEGNLVLINDLIAALPAADKATPEQLQASLDALNEVLSKADGNASTTPDLDANDYQALGLTGIANGPAFGIDLMNSVIANQDDIDSYADLVELADVIERLSQFLSGQQPDPALSSAELALIGVVGVDADNLQSILTALKSAGPEALTTLELMQSVVNEASQAANELLNPNNPAPESPQAFTDAGITGVDEDNLILINDLIAALPAADKATPEQLQASLDALNEVLSKADGNASTTPDLDANDYQALGLPGIANGPAFGIDLMNSVIANQDDIDSYADLVELADVIDRISQTLVGQRPNAMLTPDDFALVGITGVDYANQSLVIWALNAADPSRITSLSALQALIDEVPPPLPVPTLQLYGLLLLALLMLMMGSRVRRRV